MECAALFALIFLLVNYSCIIVALLGILNRYPLSEVLQLGPVLHSLALLSIISCLYVNQMTIYCDFTQHYRSIFHIVTVIKS